MNILNEFSLHKILYFLTGIILISGCARISQYALEDVEKQRLKSKNGDTKALALLSEIYKDNNQSYEVRLAAIRALSESRDPKVINNIQGSVKNSSLIELDLMKEAIKILIKFDNKNSKDSLIIALMTTEQKINEIRQDILNAIGEDSSQDQVLSLIKLYDVSKRSNIQMLKILTNTLGKIGDKKVIPILMDIAKNKKLSVDIRSRAINVLSKKDAPELVDFFINMLGDPISREKVNEFAFDVMGEMPDERMLMALLEAYQVGRHKYFILLNTIVKSLENFDNPEIKSLYLEIAQTNDFPSNIRIKAFKGLTRFSDPEVINGVVELLNDPSNYIYYNEIIGMLKESDMYGNYQHKLRMAAYKAMKKEINQIDINYD